MKILCSSICVLSLLTVSASAQVVGGTELEIGSTGTNQVADTLLSPSGAIGDDNSVDAGHSIAVGRYNVLGNQTSNGYSLAAFGKQNTMGGSYSLTVGYLNESHGKYSAIIGRENVISHDPVSGDAAQSALVVGGGNVNDHARYSIIVGTGNVASQAHRTALFGQGLISNWDKATIVGEYNDSTVAQELRFAVGVGADENNRNNAFEVHSDGTILMIPQGDISMGEFE
ncbi:MAG: hypothetical protein WA771_14925 [Chthoniobacterales bacterium]